MYGCEKCNGEKIDSYEGAAHKDYLLRCEGELERYFWKSRCYDWIEDCPEGDDEDPNAAHCNPRGTTTTTTTTTISPTLCGQIEISGSLAGSFGGVYHREGYTTYL